MSISLPELATHHTRGGRLLKSVYSTSFQLLDNPLTPWLGGLLLRPRCPAAAMASGEWVVGAHRRVLALTAHEDDLEFFCGGTLRRLYEAGAAIHALVLTDGEKGGNLKGLGTIRQQEEKRAAQLLGYQSLQFGHLPDFGLPHDPRLLPLIDRAWSEIRPDLVLAFDPRGMEPGFVNRDHTTLGKAVIQVARRKLGGRSTVCFYATRHPNILVNIDRQIDWKIRAVLCHRSQLRFLPVSGYPRLIRFFGSLFAAWAPCRYAEPLYRLF